MSMKKIIIISAASFVAVFSAIIIVFSITCYYPWLTTCYYPWLTSPLNKSNEMIREDILKEIPIGTNIEDAIIFIEGNKNWKIHRIDEEKGYEIDSNGEHPLIEFSHQTYALVGKKSIYVSLGTLLEIFNTYFEAGFAFDENDNLIDILVWRQADVL